MTKFKNTYAFSDKDKELTIREVTDKMIDGFIDYYDMDSGRIAEQRIENMQAMMGRLVELLYNGGVPYSAEESDHDKRIECLQEVLDSHDYEEVKG